MTLSLKYLLPKLGRYKSRTKTRGICEFNIGEEGIAAHTAESAIHTIATSQHSVLLLGIVVKGSLRRECQNGLQVSFVSTGIQED